MKRLKTVEQWQKLLKNSTEQPFLLFKLSMTCFSSLSAKKELGTLQTKLPIYTVIVQLDRAVSRAVTEDIDVKHESPQLFIIKDQRGIWQATHYHIKESIVSEAIEKYV